MQKFLLLLASATTCLGMTGASIDRAEWKSAAGNPASSPSSVRIDNNGKVSYKDHAASRRAASPSAVIASRKAARVSEADIYDIRTILDENFKSLENGNMEDPTAVNITEADGMIKGLPGWHGDQVYDAGGCLYVNMSIVEDPEWGFLTPVGEIFTPDLSTEGAPTVRISFRVKGVPADDETYDSLNIMVLGLSDMIPDDQTLIDFPYVNLTDEWQDVTVDVALPEKVELWSEETEDDIECPLTGIRIKLQPRETPFYLDDMAVETLTPKVAIPGNLSYRNFTDSGFTAAWDAVEGADSYSIYTYDAEYDPEQYSFLLTMNKVYTSTSNSVDVEMDTKGVIYFNVVAHKGDLISPESEPLMVFSVTPPALNDAENISEEKFDISWTPANGADGTEIWAYRMNTLDEAASGYPYLELNFADTPDTPSSTQVLFLDDYAYGWAAFPYPSFHDGAIVLDNGSAWMTGEDAKLISTGTYDLSSISGKVKVTVTASTYDYVGFIIASGGIDETTGQMKTLEAFEVPELTEDWNDYVFELEAKNPQTMFIIQVNNLGVLAISDIKVEASFPAGAVISYPYFTEYTDSDHLTVPMPGNESDRIRYIGRSIKDLVVSIDGEERLLEEAISDYSAPKFVDLRTGVTSVGVTEQESRFYTLDGIYVGKERPAQKGIYIRRDAESASKVIVK